MEISCDACGKKYRVDETRMKGEMARVKCKACSSLMVVTKPRPEIISEPPPDHETFEPSDSGRLARTARYATATGAAKRR